MSIPVLVVYEPSRLQVTKTNDVDRKAYSDLAHY